MPRRRSAPGPGAGGAIVLADNLYLDTHAKTSHGLVRGPSRYRILGVVDPSCAGSDAGELLDGRHRDIPIFASVEEAVALSPHPPTHCVIGVATSGGYLPEELRPSLLSAARAGLSLVSGLHGFLGDDRELVRLAEARGAEIIDVRRPRPTAELVAWSGEILKVETPRIAVLGTDCAVGKRTTTWLLAAACEAAGLKTEVIYTGQTGWLQGARYGFIFDATLNDFVSGEIERVIVECDRETAPDLMLIEGQSSLRNPYGPCGSEMICSAGAVGVVLQHAPRRRFYVGMEELGLEIPPLGEDKELIQLLGSQLWALTLNDEGLDLDQRETVRDALEAELDVPVLFPLAASRATDAGAPAPEMEMFAELIVRRLRG